jgi:predicted MFS family arabinose efflux permease
MDGPQQHRAATGSAIGFRQIYTLLLVSLIYTCHSIDRFIINVLVEPIKQEFGIGDGAAGMLTGAAAAIAFVIAALPLGWLADRVSRRNLLSALCFGWSAFTMVSGMVANFTSLLLTRIGVTVLEAGAATSSLSLLADTFSPNRRSTAFGIFYTSTAVGAAVCFAAGGHLAHLYGWRWVFILAGIPGIILAVILFLTVREPARQNALEDKASQIGLAATTRGLLADAVAVRLLFASGFAALVHSALWTWLVSFLVRSHGLSLATAASAMALAAGIATAIGNSVLGALADRVARTHQRRALLVPAFTTAITVPLGMAALLVPSATGAVVLLVALGFFIGAWPAPSFAVLASVAPKGAQASSMAIAQIINNVVGVGIGAPLVGLLSDSFGEAHGLRWALVIILLFNLAASALYLAAARHKNPS